MADARLKIEAMRESMHLRRQKLEREKEEMKLKQDETNEKFQKYFEIRLQLKQMCKFYYEENLRLVNTPTKEVGAYFEFKEYEVPQQVEEFVIVPTRNERGQEQVKYFNSDFDALSPDDERRCDWWFPGEKAKGSPYDLPDALDYYDPDRGKTTQDDDYQAKILTLYDDEKKATLLLHDSGAKDAPLFYARISQSVGDVAFFLLSLSHITNIPLLFSINVKEFGYQVEGNSSSYTLAAYEHVKEVVKNGITSSTFVPPSKEEKNNLENAICFLNKDLCHLAYVIGCPATKFQDSRVLPFVLFEDFAHKFTGEPCPLEKIDNSKALNIFKNIDTFLYRTTRRELQKYVVEDYFASDNFPVAPEEEPK
ncbi:MAG: hypothetical protein P4M11_13885 [Candidatus Pacebacteria bacterium]|nr:hypothetical protein [Candidatus Paceibacterota bacterium]